MPRTLLCVAMGARPSLLRAKATPGGCGQVTVGFISCAQLLVACSHAGGARERTTGEHTVGISRSCRSHREVQGAPPEWWGLREGRAAPHLSSQPATSRDSLRAAEAPAGAATGFWTSRYSEQCLISHEPYPGKRGGTGWGRQAGVEATPITAAHPRWLLSEPHPHLSRQAPGINDSSQVMST